MKTNHLNFAIIALIMSLLSCNGHDKPKKPETKTNKIAVKADARVTPDTLNDKQVIQKLIRNILVWAEDRGSVPDLLPYMINKKDSLVTGFDLDRLQGIDDSLRNTGFFSKEFIENYNHIIQALNKKMKDKQIAPFSTGDIPPFAFDSDSDPWCDCQDVPYDGEDAFSVAANLVDVHIIELNNESGKMYWSWGSLPKDASPDRRTISYKFNVKKEDGKWKVTYLQGFDIKRA